MGFTYKRSKERFELEFRLSSNTILAFSSYGGLSVINNTYESHVKRFCYVKSASCLLRIYDRQVKKMLGT